MRKKREKRERITPEWKIKRDNKNNTYNYPVLAGRGFVVVRRRDVRRGRGRTPPAAGRLRPVGRRGRGRDAAARRRGGVVHDRGVRGRRVVYDVTVLHAEMMARRVQRVVVEIVVMGVLWQTHTHTLLNKCGGGGARVSGVFTGELQGLGSPPTEIKKN